MEVDVEVLASGRFECSGQCEYISRCRIVMIVICNNILFLSNLCEHRRCITVTEPPLICIFTPLIVIHLLCSCKFDKNTMLLKITVITIVQREMYSYCPLRSSLPLAYTSTSISTRPPFFFNHGAIALVGQGLLIVKDSWSRSIRQTTLGRTVLDEWPARCRDLYLTTHTLTRDRHPCPRQDLKS